MARRLLDGNRQREARRQVILLDKLAAQFRGQLERELKAAMRDMIDRWEATHHVDMPRGFVDRIGATYLQMASAAIEAFSGRILQQSKHLGFQLERKEDFSQTMRRRALQYIGQEAVRRRIQQVTETTRRQIVGAVDRGYRDGSPLPEVASSIRGFIPAIARYRADAIARTETHGAANYGSNEAAKLTGLPLRREWLSAEDERTRETHKEADGQIVGQDEAFSVGGELLMYPGDPSGSPEETVNCRCTLGYLVDDGIDSWQDPAGTPGAGPGLVEVTPPPAPASQFAYETAKMPTTSAEADTFIKAAGIALNTRLDGMNIASMQGALRAAMEVTERFDLKPLTGIGPSTRFGLKPVKDASAAIVMTRMIDKGNVIRNVAILHTPVKFGNVKEYAKSHAISVKNAAYYDGQAVTALKALEDKGKVDPRVLAARAKMEKGSYSWTYSSLLDPSENARVVTYHEYGHVLHLVDKRIGKQIDEFLANEKPLDSGWQYLVSKYGGSSSTIKNSFARQRFNEREFIAESFSIYMHAPPSQWFRIHPELLKIFKEADKKA
jgi:hypothetical protein